MKRKLSAKKDTVDKKSKKNIPSTAKQKTTAAPAKIKKTTKTTVASDVKVEEISSLKKRLTKTKQTDFPATPKTTKVKNKAKTKVPDEPVKTQATKPVGAVTSKTVSSPKTVTPKSSDAKLTQQKTGTKSKITVTPITEEKVNKSEEQNNQFLAEKIRELVRRNQEDGFISYDDIIEVLPDAPADDLDYVCVELKKLGIYNPRLNIVYLIRVNRITEEIIKTVEREVICYE